MRAAEMLAERTPMAAVKPGGKQSAAALPGRGKTGAPRPRSAPQLRVPGTGQHGAQRWQQGTGVRVHVHVHAVSSHLPAPSTAVWGRTARPGPGADGNRETRVTPQGLAGRSV